ncbi:MAG: hypothetical protein ACO3HF_00980 [Burkholderiaceae bacterium]
MAQQFPTTAQVIYDTLVADATFMALLGTYSFKNSVGPTPAISIVTPGADLPQVRQVEGLECVIQDVGNISRMDYVAGASDFTVTYSVFLICWHEAKGQDMTTAATRIMRLFGGADAIETVATSDGLGALVQTLVRIPSTAPILA